MTAQIEVIEPAMGTVTFVFTDVEGSTLRWQEHPGPMAAALSRHDEIMRAAITTHRGYVFRPLATP